MSRAVRVPKTWQVSFSVRLADGTEMGRIVEAHGDTLFDAMDNADLEPIEGEVSRDQAEGATELNIRVKWVSG